MDGENFEDGDHINLVHLGFLGSELKGWHTIGAQKC